VSIILYGTIASPSHLYSVSLPVAIVDLLDDVEYGEVFVALVADASQGCTKITLGFTSFSGMHAIQRCNPRQLCLSSFQCVQNRCYYSNRTVPLL